MKFIKLFVILFAVSSFACTQAPSDGNYGVKIEKPESAQELTALLTAMGDKTELEATIKGTIKNVCQAEGCWFKTEVAGFDDIRINAVDHSFFLPKDCAGKSFVAQGKLVKTIISVDELKHLAEDEGKSAEEIAAITEPSEEFEFEANGVILK